MIHILGDISTCEYKKCGAKCCTEGIHLTLRDIRRIISAGYSIDDFLEMDEENQIFKIKGKHGRCFFLGEELECRIRENEPLVCRLLPFRITEVTYSDEPIMRLKPVVECPGKGYREKIDYKRIETDATSFLHEDQQLIKKIKTKGMRGILEELSASHD